MAQNITGIAIVIKAFLPTGKTLDEQYEALTIVKDAHASGDYSGLLAAAKIDEVKTEQKTRRMEDNNPVPFASDGITGKPTDETGQLKNTDGEKTEQQTGEYETATAETDLAGEVPTLLKKGKSKQANENTAA